MRIIYLLPIILSLSTHSQHIKNSDLVSTEWFADNLDNKFFNSDSLNIYQLLQSTSDYKTLSKDHIKTYYFEGQELTTINFYKENKLYIGELNFRLCGIINEIVDWTWKFDPKNRVLTFYKNGKNEMSFAVINQDTKNESWEREIDEGKITKFQTRMKILKLRKI